MECEYISFAALLRPLYSFSVGFFGTLGLIFFVVEFVWPRLFPRDLYGRRIKRN